MTAVVRGPDVVLGVDSQAVRVRKEPGPKTPHETRPSRRIQQSIGSVRWNRKMWAFELTATPDASPATAPSGILKKPGTT